MKAVLYDKDTGKINGVVRTGTGPLLKWSSKTKVIFVDDEHSVDPLSMVVKDEKIIIRENTETDVKEESCNADDSNIGIPVYMDRKRIVYAGEYYPPRIIGGGEITIEYLMRSMEREGWGTYAYVIHPEKNIAGLENYRDVIVRSISSDLALTDFRSFLEKVKPHVVLTTPINLDLVHDIIMPTAKSLNAKFAVYEQFYTTIAKNHNHTRMLEQSVAANQYQKIGKDILLNADIVLVNSGYSKKVMRYYQNYEDSIIFEPPIEFDRYVAKDRNPKYVTLINPDEGKGGRTFINLVKSLPHIDFKCVLMKKNESIYDEIVELSSMVSNLKVENFTDDMRYVYRDTLILLFPTVIDETYGRSILEAMANGIPVIARDVGGVKDTLGGNGILVDRDEPDDEWIRVTDNLFGDRSKIENLSRKGLEYIDSLRQRDFVGEFESIVNIDFSCGDSKSLPCDVVIDRDMDKREILTFSMNFPGVEDIFMNMKKIFKLEHRRVDTGTREIPDKYSVTVNPELIMVGGWDEFYPFALRRLRKNFPEVPIYICWASNLLQMNFSRETLLFGEVINAYRDGMIDGVMVSGSDMANVFNLFFEGNIHYLPLFIDEERYIKTLEKKSKKSPWIDDDTFVLSLFCSAGPRKNIHAQLGALKYLEDMLRPHGKKLMLYTNVLSRDVEFAKINRFLADMVGVKYRDVGWMEKSEYMDIISHDVDLGLQVSLAETYDYVVAEHLIMRKPCVVSTAVPVVNELNIPDRTKEKMIVGNYSSPRDIAEKCYDILINNVLRNEMDMISAALIDDCHKRMAIIKEIIESRMRGGKK